MKQNQIKILTDNIMCSKNCIQIVKTMSDRSIKQLNSIIDDEDSMVNNQNRQFLKQIIDKSNQVLCIIQLFKQNIGYSDLQNSDIINQLLGIHNMYHKMQFLKGKILSKSIVRNNLKTIIESDPKFSQFMKNDHSLLLQLNSYFAQAKSTSQIQVEIDFI